MATPTDMSYRTAQGKRAWLVAGSLMIAAPIVTAAMSSVAVMVPVVSLLGTALYAAALVIFAVGFRGQGRVAGDRKAGMVALIVLATVTLIVAVVWLAYSSYPGDPRPLFEFGKAETLVRFAVAVVAVVEVSRAHAIPAPWHNAPLWALAAIAGLWLAQNLLGSALHNQDSADLAFLLTLQTIEGFLRTAIPIAFGVLAVVLAMMPPKEKTVDVL